jgi:penicillin-binding protein 1C
MQQYNWNKADIAIALTLAIFGSFIWLTCANLKPAPESFHAIFSDSHHVQILDRYGEPLNTTYQNQWNIHRRVPLYAIPEFLKQAFVISEDKRFYQHSGPDWLARFSALAANIKAMRKVRGASTITEQVVRMIHPRPRTLWSRWLEGFDAQQLEQHFSKDDLLEFYINQVPYAANRRGVAQAAHYYFNRDLDTLSEREILALVVLVRAPSRLDLWQDTQKIAASIERLTSQLVDAQVISTQQQAKIIAQRLTLEAPSLSIRADAFLRHVKRHPMTQFAGWPHVKTTLDGKLQQDVQAMLNSRLDHLKHQKIHNGAVLVVDHTSSEILAWAVADSQTTETPARLIDAVTTPRQPGSALKPFLYALALQQGWSAATLIEDAPLAESVGQGLHHYQNYSRTFYGAVTLRQALGNSLNIPALKTLQYVGAKAYLHYLNSLGFKGLKDHLDVYGDGIAPGNGEVSLYELVQAYATLANQGVFHPLTLFADGLQTTPSYGVAPEEVASLMGYILSDPQARELEFGRHSVLNFPVQTAVKTGTSSDYRDSWAIGYNTTYTVGVWMGNLDQQPTDGVTGSTGPALLLRSIFAQLNKHQQTKPLPIHKRLIKRDLCAPSNPVKSNDSPRQIYTEWFVPGTEPQTAVAALPIKTPIRLRRPTHGLHLAYDPRIPAEAQAFEFHIQGVSETDQVSWKINGESVISQGDRKIAELNQIRFLVK